MTRTATSPQRIAFRTDASLEIGTGHVMRCLTLADSLRGHGADCVFICRPHPGHLMSQIKARGHSVLALPALPSSFQRSAADPAHGAWLATDWSRDARETRQLLDGENLAWLVVDHYAIDHRWEMAQRPVCGRLMVMDDLADRAHECDLLLDPSMGRGEGDYDKLMPNGAVAMLGPRYALLRPEFASLRAESLARRKTPKLRHLLVTMGGVDKDNATGRFLEAVETSALRSDFKITVVMGPHAPWLQEVQALAARMRIQTRVRIGVEDMARLMTDCDLAIGAAGGTSWERCCLGLPAFIISLADNQHAMAATLQHAGAVLATQSPAEASQRLTEYVATKRMETFLAGASVAAAQIIDGRGAERMCREMLR